MRTGLKHTLVLFLLGFALIGGYVAVKETPLAHSADCTETKSSQYCLLEPLPIKDSAGQDFTMYDPATNNAASYINIIIKVFISIIGVLGVIMIILGGVQYMSTDAISKKEGGKEMITNSIFGLLLALASWLILNTINPNLTNINIDPPKGTAVTVTNGDGPPTVTTVTNATINGKTVAVTSRCSSESVQAAAADGVELKDGAQWGSITAIGADDAANRKSLKEAGIDVPKGNCATVGQSGCTSAYKISSVANLSNLRTKVCGSSTNCRLTLTGGTECWLHTTHQIGSGRVDLALTPELEAYVKKNQKSCVAWIPGQSSDGCGSGQAGQYTVNGSVFIRESDHYHVSQW